MPSSYRACRFIIMVIIERYRQLRLIVMSNTRGRLKNV